MELTLGPRPPVKIKPIGGGAAAPVVRVTPLSPEAVPFVPVASGAGGPRPPDSLAPGVPVAVSLLDERRKILERWFIETGISSEHIKLLLSDETTSDWDKVFTHKSLNIGEFNYELLEIIGDKMLNMIANFYIIAIKGESSVSKITNMHRALTSNKIFAKFIDARNLVKFIKISVELEPKIKADVFEAIAGNICEIIKNAINLPTAVHVIYQFMKYNLDQLPTEDFQIAKNPVQFLNDIFFQRTIIGVQVPTAAYLVKDRIGPKQYRFNYVPPEPLLHLMEPFYGEIFESDTDAKANTATEIIRRLRDLRLIPETRLGEISHID